MKLTKTLVERMAYEKAGNKADLRFDEEVRGFGVRVYPSGEKSFFVQYRFNGSPFRMSIGPFGVLTVQEARDLARKALATVRHGANPLAQRRAARAELTLRQYAERYEKQFGHTKRAWKDDKQRIETHILPHLGSRRLSAITGEDLAALQKRLMATPAIKPIRVAKKEGQPALVPPRLAGRTLSNGTVNRIIAVLRHMLREAERGEYISSSPARSLRMLPAAKPRDVFLTPKESAAIFEACCTEPNPYASALIKVALLTGRRIGELRDARWENLNRQTATLRIPDTKSGDQQHIALTEFLIGILDTLERSADNPFIFAGERAGRPLHNYVRPWRRVLEGAGLPYMPIHGLRHNAASTMIALGIPLQHVQDALGHKDSRTTGRYAHSRRPHLNAALSALGQSFLGNEAEASRRHEVTVDSTHK